MFAIATISATIGLVLQNILFLVITIFFSCILLFAFATVTENVAVRRKILNSKIFEGDVAEISLEIKSRGITPSTIDVFEKLPTALELAGGVNSAVMKLKRGEKVNINYSVRPPLRGFYNIGPTYVRCSDMLGLFSDERQLNEYSLLTAYPLITDMKRFDISTRYRKINPGSVLMRTLGHGMDFHSIRNYISSDPYNRINWKASARKRELMVNQYELEDLYDLMIYIDARTITRVGTPMENSLEFAIKSAASISNAAIKKGNRVGLVIYGKEIKIIPPGNSGTHMETFLATLTATYPGGTKSFREALDLSMPYLTPKSPVVVISPLQQDATLEDAFQEMLTKKFHICLISPSIIDFERKMMGKFSPKYLLVKMERQNRLAELKSLGIDLIDWTPERSVANIMGEVIF